MSRANHPSADPEMDGIPTDFEQLPPAEHGLDWGDILLIRERLAMTPTERLRAAQALINAAARIRTQNGRA